MTRRLALADDSGIFRHALAGALEDLGWQVTISVATGEELLKALASEQVDMVVIDRAMPPTQSNEGVQAARQIRAQWPSIGILLLSAHAATPQVIELLQDVTARVGYLQKDEVADVNELASAIERILAGDVVVDRSLVQRLLNAPVRELQLARLTPQEREVLRLMAQGHSNAGIAERLHLKERTVEDHVGRVFARLGISSGEGGASNKRVLAVLTWLRLTGRYH